MITNLLPQWLPWFNLAVSVFALLMLVPLVARRVKRSRDVKARWFFGMDIALFVAIVVLVAGAAFQADILSLKDWTWLGSGGRVVVAIVVLVMLSTRSDDEPR